MLDAEGPSVNAGGAALVLHIVSALAFAVDATGDVTKCGESKPASISPPRAVLDSDMLRSSTWRGDSDDVSQSDMRAIVTQTTMPPKVNFAQLSYKIEGCMSQRNGHHHNVYSITLNNKASRRQELPLRTVNGRNRTTGDMCRREA